MNPDKDIQKINKQVKGKKATGKDNKSQLLNHLTGQFFSNPQGMGFYVEDDNIPLEIEGRNFEGLLTERKYSRLGELPNGEEIANIKRYARYLASKSIRDLGVRVAKHEAGFIYDPIRPDGKVYFITDSGFSLKLPDQPYTARYAGMLEAPIKDGKLEDHQALVNLWNLTENGKILSMGLDFSRFIPGIPHAMEVVTGGHGAGKTSCTETKRELFDPSGANSQSLKHDERDLSISAMHQGMLAFDNVNTIMPDYISDIICRLTTGQGFRTRELYTNMGEVILKLKRPIIMNGINRPGYKPDFMDRECPIELGVMSEVARLTDAEIRSKADMLIPKVRGFILSVIPKAIKLYPEVESEHKGRLPRMADFVIWAECGIRAMGLPAMSFFNAYTEVKHNEIVDVAKDTTILQGIRTLMADRDVWRGTTSELFDILYELMSEPQRKHMPKDERRLGRNLRELSPTLLELGFLYETLSDGNRTKRITKLDSGEKSYEVNVSNVSTQADPRESGTGKLTLDPDIKKSKKANVSGSKPRESGSQNKTDSTDIRNGNFSPEKQKNTGKNSSPNRSYIVLKQFYFNMTVYKAGDIVEYYPESPKTKELIAQCKIKLKGGDPQ